MSDYQKLHSAAQLHLAAFQPDIALNLGAMIRIAVGFDTTMHVIEPCGFPFSPNAVKRSAMDYADHVTLHRHVSWESFLTQRPEGGRLCLLTTADDAPTLWTHVFAQNDVVLVGRESVGAPTFVHAAADRRLRIPLSPHARSLNVAVAAGIALAEARRQFGS